MADAMQLSLLLLAFTIGLPINAIKTEDVFLYNIVKIKNHRGYQDIFDRYPQIADSFNAEKKYFFSKGVVDSFFLPAYGDSMLVVNKHRKTIIETTNRYYASQSVTGNTHIYFYMNNGFRDEEGTIYLKLPSNCKATDFIQYPDSKSLTRNDINGHLRKIAPELTGYLLKGRFPSLYNREIILSPYSNWTWALDEIFNLGSINTDRTLDILQHDFNSSGYRFFIDNQKIEILQLQHTQNNRHLLFIVVDKVIYSLPFSYYLSTFINENHFFTVLGSYEPGTGMQSKLVVKIHKGKVTIVAEDNSFSD